MGADLRRSVRKRKGERLVGGYPAVVSGVAESAPVFVLNRLRRSQLDAQFPQNITSILQLALIHLDADRLDDSYYYFSQARVCDPFSLEHMDHFALLLKLRGTPHELNRLAHDLLSIDQNSSEAWVAMAMHCHVQGDHPKAGAHPLCARTCHGPV
jgi:hypothetical protein